MEHQVTAEGMEAKSEEPASARRLADLPPDALIILPMRETVLFPGVILPL